MRSLLARIVYWLEDKLREPDGRPTLCVQCLKNVAPTGKRRCVACVRGER